MKKLLLVIMAISLALFAASAEAAQTTSNINASVTVATKCMLSSVNDVVFGTDYDPTDSSANQSGVGSFNMRCTKGTSYDMYISGTRQMTDGTENLAFEIYSDAFATAWPGTSGSSVVSSSNGIVSNNVNGEIAALIDVGAGSYSTASPLVITIDY